VGGGGGGGVGGGGVTGETPPVAPEEREGGYYRTVKDMMCYNNIHESHRDGKKRTGAALSSEGKRRKKGKRNGDLRIQTKRKRAAWG